MRNSCKALLLLSILLLLPLSFALDAPNLSSSSHTEGEWGPANSQFSWDPVESAIRYCYSLNSDPDADAPDDPCTDDTDVSMPSKISGGDYYFHVKAVSASEASPTSTFHVRLDIDSPDWESWPPLTAEPLPEGGIKLTWVPAVDPESGIREYEIYRKLMGGFSVRDTPVYLIVSSSTTSLSDNNDMMESTTYHYKVRAIDNVGNPGSVSNEAFAETVAFCDLDIDFSVSLSDDESKLSLEITSDGKIYQPSLKAVLPSGEEHVFFDGAEPFDSWTGSLGLEGIEQGYIDFTLSAQELFGDDCSQEKRFIYDLVKPEASFVFPKYNDRVSETVPIEASVEEKGSFKSGIASVEFFLRKGSSWESIGLAEDSGEGIYKLDWDSFSAENGQQKLRMDAIDKAGNKSEATITVNVLNAFETSLDLNQALEQAAKARDEALAVKFGLAEKAIYSETLERLMEEADSNLSTARQVALEGGLESETNAKQLIAQAIVSYQEAAKTVSTSPYRDTEFVFNKEQVGILLNAAGYSGAAADQAAAAIENYDPKRKLQILKVDDFNSTYYRAVIEVSFEIDVNILKDSNAGDYVLQVVEVVPKEFAEYAAELDSNISFEVLADDPRLAFSLEREQYKKRGFSYSLKENLSLAQADALIEESIINKFVAPPILIPSQAGLGFLPSLPFDFLLFAGASIAMAVAVIVTIFALRRFVTDGKRRKSPLAEKGRREQPPKKKEAPKEEKPKKKEKPKGGFGLGIPKIRKKEPESPLSVFGKA